VQTPCRGIVGRSKRIMMFKERDRHPQFGGLIIEEGPLRKLETFGHDLPTTV
jgi:hypothetical protein